MPQVSERAIEPNYWSAKEKDRQVDRAKTEEKTEMTGIDRDLFWVGLGIVVVGTAVAVALKKLSTVFWSLVT